MPIACTDGDVAAGRRVGLPGLDVAFPRADSVRSPAVDRAAAGADRAGVRRSGTDRGVAGRRWADRDLGAAQPAAYSRVCREVTRLWGDALPIRRSECEFDPSVLQQPRVDPADFCAIYLYGAAAQPAVNGRVGREVALGGQDSRAAGGLPAEFDAAIIEPPRNDAPGALVVALRADRHGEVAGDDRGNGGQGCECGDGGAT